MTSARVELRGIEKRFGDTPALAGLDLDLPAGEITVVLGPSGCGKTTLLRVLAGLEEPDAGSVTVGGRVVNDPGLRVPAERRRVGMVFQDAMLWPHLSVRGSIAFPLGRGRGRDPRVLEAARAAEVEPFLDRYPGELSGGERQRAAIARAIVARPELLLLDEPLSRLDANLRVRLLRTIRTVQRGLRVTTCYVTHDQEEALGLADRIVVVREGRVLQAGPPEEVYSRPRTRFVATFVGLASLLAGRRSGSELETPLGSFPDGGGPDGEVLLAVRPETVRLGDGEGPAGEVLDCSFRGDRWLVRLRVGEHELLALSARRRAPGESTTVTLDRPPPAVLDDEEAR